MDTPNDHNESEGDSNNVHPPRTSKGIRVNGPRLQALRQQAGLTQEELAALSGFSDRLIRKAESSGLLRYSTVRIIAMTLSERGLKTTAEDLTFLSVTIAMEISRLLLTAEPQWLDHLSARFRDEFELHVTGEALSIPFSGTFIGMDGLQRFIVAIRGSIVVSSWEDKNVKTYSSASEELMAFQTSTRALQPNGQGFASIWWYIQFCFVESSISSLRIFFDTGAMCRLLGGFIDDGSRAG